jgi:DNA primase large subunit
MVYKKKNITVFLIALLLLLHVQLTHAAIHDRVVAFVDNQAITLSEFEEQYAGTLKLSPQVTKEEVLNTVINRILLLKEARKYRIEAPTREEVLNEYINLKVRAFIRVSDAAAEAFYRQNTAQFAGREYETVRGEIENYLTEKMLNDRLKEILVDLRKSSYIRVQLK